MFACWRWLNTVLPVSRQFRISRQTNAPQAQADGKETTCMPAEERFAHLKTIEHFVDLYVLELDWHTALDNFFEGLLQASVDRYQAAALLHHLLYSLELECTKRNPGFAEPGKRLPAMHSVAAHWRTLKEVHSLFQAQLISLSETLADWRERMEMETMLRVKDYVDEHFADNGISLTALSTVFGINEKTVSRLFKTAFGQNFIDYVIGLRIYKAKRLLCESQLAVDHIASQVGYAGPISFRRTFKRREGLSPSDYRNRWKGKSGNQTLFDKGEMQL